jgi:hypothetical protein
MKPHTTLLPPHEAVQTEQQARRTADASDCETPTCARTACTPAVSLGGEGSAAGRGGAWPRCYHALAPVLFVEGAFHGFVARRAAEAGRMVGATAVLGPSGVPDGARTLCTPVCPPVCCQASRSGPYLSQLGGMGFVPVLFERNVLVAWRAEELAIVAEHLCAKLHLAGATYEARRMVRRFADGHDASLHRLRARCAPREELVRVARGAPQRRVLVLEGAAQHGRAALAREAVLVPDLAGERRGRDAALRRARARCAAWRLVLIVAALAPQLVAVVPERAEQLRIALPAREALLMPRASGEHLGHDPALRGARARKAPRHAVLEVATLAPRHVVDNLGARGARPLSPHAQPVRQACVRRGARGRAAPGMPREAARRTWRSRSTRGGTRARAPPRSRPLRAGRTCCTCRRLAGPRHENPLQPLRPRPRSARTRDILLPS